MELYKYNQQAYENMLEQFKTTNKTAIIHPTGIGKNIYLFKMVTR